jgi:hypothetical protein
MVLKGERFVRQQIEGRLAVRDGVEQHFLTGAAWEAFRRPSSVSVT